MKQDEDLEAVVRQRIRGLRLARGWSLDELAGRCLISPSTLSRIETGHRRIALDQMVTIARVLGTTLDQLVESDADDDVVIRPHCDPDRGVTTWLLSRDSNKTAALLRVTRQVPQDLRVHPGRDWFTVLSGTIELRLGERTILVAHERGRRVLHHDPARVRRVRRPGRGPLHPRPRGRTLPPRPGALINCAGAARPMTSPML